MLSTSNRILNELIIKVLSCKYHSYDQTLDDDAYKELDPEL